MNVHTMDIPIDVEVKCCGRNCGRSTHIVLNPVTKEITHLVVKQRAFPHTERLVPVGFMTQNTSHVIRLSCDAPDLDTMNEFIEAEFIQSKEPHPVWGPLLMWPYTYAAEKSLPRSHKRIPVGKLAIRRGARVVARDGQVGRIDEFVVDRSSEHITHLVMREGPLSNEEEVTIPVSYIERMDEDTVYLNIEKASVAVLPVVSVHRDQIPTKE